MVHSRLISNIRICNMLLAEILKEENKDIRFQQLLYNLNITEQVRGDSKEFIPYWQDKYNEESITTLNKLLQNAT